MDHQLNDNNINCDTINDLEKIHNAVRKDTIMQKMHCLIKNLLLPIAGTINNLI